jgi:dienelactone hydrolase
MPKHRNFSPWAYWRLRVDSVTAPPVLTRERLHELLGALPAMVEADVEVTDVEQRDGYRVERIVFDAEAAMSVPALLLVPDGADDGEPRPAVLAVHGHGTTKDTISTPGGVGVDEGAANADYAHRLASAGLVVLAPDLRGFGERSDWTPDDHYHCDVDLVNGILVGTTPFAQNLWDMARCLDVLQGLPYVDEQRMGACGWSYGGTITLFLAAWDERVAAALVSCALASIASSHRVPWNLCGSQVLPGMAGEIDHPALVGLIAPRPLIAENAEDDLIFPLDAARATLETAQAAYEAAGGRGGTRLFVHDGDHRFDGTDSLPALIQALSSTS